MKAQVIAHYCEHNTRETYAAENAMAAADKNKRPTGTGAPLPDWASYRQGR